MRHLARLFGAVHVIRKMAALYGQALLVCRRIPDQLRGIREDLPLRLGKLYGYQANHQSAI
jgi:hypothetical protein